EATIAWNEDKLDGARKFLDRVWRFYEQLEIIDENPNLDVIINQSIDKVTKDYANIGYNTAIAQLMTLLNAYSKEKKVSQSQAEIFVQLLAPVTPHICEELWTKLGHEQSIFKSDWPVIDETKLANQAIEIVIQINGKIKGRLNVTETTTADEQLELAKEALTNELVDKQIVKVINVPQKIVNLIIK
ncbi:MAG: class I tRNA ligase family protein, partial [Mycoplasmatales bacterium]